MTVISGINERQAPNTSRRRHFRYGRSIRGTLTLTERNSAPGQHGQRATLCHVSALEELYIVSSRCSSRHLTKGLIPAIVTLDASCWKPIALQLLEFYSDNHSEKFSESLCTMAYSRASFKLLQWR